MQQILEQAKAARDNPLSSSHLYYLGMMHNLAEAQYLPALEFFISCLSDSRWDWRVDCLSGLGFHYEFPPDGEIVAKIRHLLIEDPVNTVRMTAAAVLGTRSKWPDTALLDALQHDSDQEVRLSAFEALLTLAGVPFSIVREEVQRIETGTTQANVEELKRILYSAQIDWSF